MKQVSSDYSFRCSDFVVNLLPIVVQNYIGLEKDARSKRQLIIKISGIIEWSLLFITQHHTFNTTSFITGFM